MSTFRPASLLLAVSTVLVLAGGNAQAQSSDLLSGRNIGAVGGAVAGGIAGKQLVGKKNRTLGIAGGALAGGVLGGVAGNMYDNSGKKRPRDPATTGTVSGSKSSSLINGQNVGIVAGAVGGGVLGNKLGGKKHKTLGTSRRRRWRWPGRRCGGFRHRPALTRLLQVISKHANTPCRWRGVFVFEAGQCPARRGRLSPRPSLRRAR